MPRPFIYLSIVIVTLAFCGCDTLRSLFPKPPPPDTKMFLTSALQRYDFTVKENGTELLVQFRRGGRHGDGLVIEAPDKMTFGGTEMEQINTVESFGEFATQGIVKGFRRHFPSPPQSGELTLTKANTTYVHQVNVPQVAFGTFPKEFDPKKPIRLPIAGADTIGKGRWTLSVKRAIWAHMLIIWVPGESETKDYVIGKTPAEKIYFDTTAKDPAIIIDLPEIKKAPTTAFYTVTLSAVFPCNDGDDVAVPDPMTGIECTYVIPQREILFPGQTLPQSTAPPGPIPTPPFPQKTPKAK